VERHFDMSHLLQLLLLLAIIVPAAKLAGALANKIGQPAVFGEILIGLILGPTVFNILGWSLFAHPSLATHAGNPPALYEIVRDLAEIGVILLMFIAGMETNLEEMRRVGKVAFWSATGGVALPLVGGAVTAAAFGLPFFWEGIFIGTILTATSVSISAQTLIELGHLRSREGSTILGAAVIDDVQGIILLSLVVAFAKTTGSVDLAAVGLVVVRMLAYFAVAIFLGRYLTTVCRWADGLGVSQGLLAVVLSIALFYAWAAEAGGGVAAITGSYLVGVLFAQTPYKHRIDEGIHPLTYSMLVPVFFISIGLAANGRELGEHVVFTIVLVVVAIVTKAIGCGVLARVTGFNTQESVRVGVGMISRGEVGLIVAGYGLANGIIGRDVFSASVLMVLVTTMITPPLLRLTFPRDAGVVTKGAVVEESVASVPEETERS
jgi:Kef-type K+ transport system membrane component KefB